MVSVVLAVLLDLGALAGEGGLAGHGDLVVWLDWSMGLAVLDGSCSFGCTVM